MGSPFKDIKQFPEEGAPNAHLKLTDPAIDEDTSGKRITTSGKFVSAPQHQEAAKVHSPVHIMLQPEQTVRADGLRSTNPQTFAFRLHKDALAGPVSCFLEFTVSNTGTAAGGQGEMTLSHPQRMFTVEEWVNSGSVKLASHAGLTQMWTEYLGTERSQLVAMNPSYGTTVTEAGANVLAGPTIVEETSLTIRLRVDNLVTMTHEAPIRPRTIRQGGFIEYRFVTNPTGVFVSAEDTATDATEAELTLVTTSVRLVVEGFELPEWQEQVHDYPWLNPPMIRIFFVQFEKYQNQMALTAGTKTLVQTRMTEGRILALIIHIGVATGDSDTLPTNEVCRSLEGDGIIGFERNGVDLLDRSTISVNRWHRDFCVHDQAVAHSSFAYGHTGAARRENIHVIPFSESMSDAISDGSCHGGVLLAPDYFDIALTPGASFSAGTYPVTVWIAKQYVTYWTPGEGYSSPVGVRVE